MSLTNAFLQEVEYELNGNYFFVEDFIIETRNYQSFIELNIVYIYLPQYKFEGEIYKDEARFKVEFNPGTVTTIVKRDQLSKYEFLSSIREWLKNTHTEMTKTPIARQVNNHEELLKLIQEKVNSMGENGERFFTKEEGEELRNKLNELEELYKKSVVEQYENKQTQEKELQKFNFELNTLRNHLEVLNRKNWFLSFSVRLFNWIKRNPDVTRRVAGFSRELLPEEAKNIVSQEALDQLLPPSSLEIASDTESE
ncbi:hypothetical protein LYSIN_01984 [Lysinibacillus sphaericus]|uniref:Uncharacterized protein n=1 Tax=Lysinibacillus sphaericus TaxID=1421 RepID=A0A2S5D293_LYSSH|nr:hypothetical protein [Lysinibacillus sphaericus]POZ57200.1 hypothetical protein LYSIN_01984 [Lysinibacillus sphaericus]